MASARRVRGIGIVVLALLAPPASAPGVGARPDPLPCDDPAADAWVAEQRDRVVSANGLEAFAAEVFGAWTACSGEVTTRFDGAPFGVVALEHGDAAVLRAETMPPEASLVTLRAREGFPDERSARGALEAYVRAIGVALEWGRPEIAREGDLEVRRYADPDPGLNAAASLVYRGDTLVELRFTLAL
jgi:hypothetical protein